MAPRRTESTVGRRVTLIELPETQRRIYAERM
jgi:hypothetical protein